MMKRLSFALSLALLPFPVLAAPANVDFTVAMSETVTVSGCPATCPRIAVDVGGQTRYAQYSAGSGSSSLTFSYAPTIGDLDLDGVTLSSPVDLNGGTMTDLNGNPITNLTFTVPNTTGIKINYPSLSMDFINGASGRYTLNGTAYTDLSSFLGAASGTFTRATTATYYDSTGTLQTASVNTPRFDHDPITLTPKGILIEEARTNLLTYSEDISNGAYAQENITKTTNVTASPTGTLTADKLIDNGINNRHILLAPAAGMTNGVTYTGTVFVKPAEHNYIQFLFATGVFGGTTYANFHLSGAGSVTYSDAGLLSSSIQALPNGWYRLTISAPALTTTPSDYTMFLALLNNSNITTRAPSYIGTGGGVYVWGFQMEQGAFPTSYIPTTTATVTRPKDQLIFLTSAWFNASQGTFFASWSKLVSDNSVIFELRNNLGGGTSDRINVFSGSQKSRLQIFPNGVSILDSGATYNPFTPNTIVKAGLGFQSGNSAVNVDGSVPFTSSGSFPPLSTFTKMNVGSTDNGIYGPPTSTGALNGHIQQLKHYPIRTPDAQLQLLTQ